MVFSQEITMEKNRFMMDGKKIIEREVKMQLTSTTEAAVLFSSYRTKSAIGGFLLGFGGALILADLLGGATADIRYPSSATPVGIACLAGPTAVLTARIKKKDQALNWYNVGFTNISATNSLS